MVAVVVHGPAGPHGGAGAPAEFALRTCALGRHSWLPTHRGVGARKQVFVAALAIVTAEGA